MRKTGSFTRSLIAVLGAGILAATLCGCDAVQGVVDKIDERFLPTTIEEARAKKAESVTPIVTTPAIQEDGILKVGLSAGSSAPLLISSQDGYSGMDVDTACALADKLGVRVEFIPVGAVADLESSGCDIVMNARAGDASSVAVVGSYAEEAVAFFRKGEAATIAASELEGKTIGLQASSSSEHALNETGINAAHQEFANLNEAFDALEAGTVDYVLCDAYSGAYLAATYPDIACAGTLDVPSAVGIGVPTNNEALQLAVQDALTEISSNGVLGIVRSRWIGSMPVLSAENQVSNIPHGSGESK